MNKLINIILSGLLWRRYKFLIISLLILVGAIVLSGRIHQDYIEFAKAAEQPDYLGWSFLIKWVVWIICFLVFCLANNQYNKRKEKEQILAESPRSVISKFMDRKSKDVHGEPEKHDDGGDDPFDHLRNKEKLRSYAEVIIENHDKEK